MKDYLNSFAEKASAADFTFKLEPRYGNHEIMTVKGERLPEVSTSALFFTFCCDPHKGDNSRGQEQKFLRLVKRNKSISIVSDYSIYYGRAYYITTATEAETIRADREQKDAELEIFWKAEHEKRTRQTASA